MYSSYTTLLTFAALLGLAACSTHAENDEWESGDVVTVAFKLSVYEGGTRSDNADDATVTEGPTWGDEYNKDSIYYDAAIATQTVKIQVTDNTGKKVLTDVTPLTCVKDESGNTYTYYGCANRSAFDGLDNGTTLRCMVTANASTNTFGLSDLPCNNTEEGSLYIPMWGVGSFTLDKTTREQASVEVALLRAAAKCRVKLNDEMRKKYTLSNVVLHPAVSWGYVYPNGYDLVETTEDLYLLKDNNAQKLYGFHPYTGETETGLTQTFLQEPGDAQAAAWIGYFPEYTNSAEAPIYLTLNLNKGTSSTVHTVAFKDYTTGALYTDLMRNHLYDFTITGVGRGLDIDLKVDDWTTEDITWDFTEQISGSTLSWSSCSSVNEQTVTLLSGVAAEGRFTILSPKGVTWYATLTSDEYHTFVFVDEDGEELGNTVSGEVDGKTASVIWVKAVKEDNTIQHKANLTFYIEYKDGSTRKVDNLSGWTVVQTI